MTSWVSYGYTFHDTNCIASDALFWMAFWEFVLRFVTVLGWLGRPCTQAMGLTLSLAARTRDFFLHDLSSLGTG
jgi:hypothetical protein